MQEPTTNKGITVIFKQDSYNGIINCPIKLQCLNNDKVSYLVEKYKNLTRDINCKFMFNSKNLNPNSTVEESGIKDDDVIIVVH